MAVNVKENEAGAVHERLVQARNRIIHSVLTEGLKPSIRLGRNNGNLLSGSRHPLYDLSGIIIDSEDNRPMFKIGLGEYYNTVERNLYENEHSVLPVVMERPWNGISYDSFYHDPENAQLLSGRCRNSFLVVTSRDYSDVCTRLFYPATPEKNLCAIFPSGIWQDYRIAHMKQGFPFPVRTTSRVVEKKVGSLTIPVPDFETILQDISWEVDGPKWVHGVRLPTLDDLDHI